MHHCAATVKKEVLPVLEKDLEKQVEVIRESERKKRKEEDAKKAEETAKKEKAKGENIDVVFVVFICIEVEYRSSICRRSLSRNIKLHTT